MDASVASEAKGLEARAEALVASYERAGYARLAPAILQPAEPFLDLSGEDIRNRIYLTTAPGGGEFCLRPDLTIPVSRDYLASPEAGQPAGFCYLGPVFRHASERAGEFLQAGIESFGRADKAAADAEMLALGLEATAHYGLAAPDIRIGDVALFAGLIAGLELPPAWKRRLIKDFNRKTNLAQDLDRLVLGGNNQHPEYQGVLAALAGSDPHGAHALVTDLLSIAGINAVGGRSVGEIADRFLEQSALGASAKLPRDVRALIERFLTIAGDPDEAAADLRALASEGNMGQALTPALDLFESRTGFLAAQGIDLKRVRFSTAFGRGFDYYTGFVFELTDPARTGDPLVAGGRYDALLTRLGAAEPIPAVGFAVWIERLASMEARHELSRWCMAVPAKGRLQENAENFFARAGLALIKPRGQRDYRGAVAGLDGVEVAYLSASEITGQLAAGAVHLGVTGEDLVREMIPDADAKVVLIEGLGFGHANVVVAVPQAWIDVRTMADLDDVATSFRHTHDRKLRVATKYVNLTRGFFSAHGIIDYRIVESAGATEGAPAAGTAELIVDITTSGATLAANALKVVEDGVILRSQANLVAARGAPWDEARRETARVILDRIAAQARARAFREVRARFAACDAQLVENAKQKFGVATPFGGPTSSGMLTLHCPPGEVYALTSYLRENGAEAVAVADLDYVFSRDNPLYAKLEAGL